MRDNLERRFNSDVYLAASVSPRRHRVALMVVVVVVVAAAASLQLTNQAAEECRASG